MERRIDWAEVCEQGGHLGASWTWRCDNDHQGSDQPGTPHEGLFATTTAELTLSWCYGVTDPIQYFYDRLAYELPSPVHRLAEAVRWQASFSTV